MRDLRFLGTFLPHLSYAILSSQGSDNYAGRGQHMYLSKALLLKGLTLWEHQGCSLDEEGLV